MKNDKDGDHMNLLILIKRISQISFMVMIVSYITKDTLSSSMGQSDLVIDPPKQYKTDKQSFDLEVNHEHYYITPKYDYIIEGIVVSTHHSDAFLDMAHEEWRDYLNIADLCVIWGENVKNGVYKDMDFNNGNWTCYYSWPNSEVRQRFHEDQLSNNHLLTSDDAIKQTIMDVEPGDYIRIEGILADYANPANGFNRKTSIIRTDRGQGACETIFVEKFDIVQQMNSFKRIVFDISKFLFIVSSILFLLLSFTSTSKQSD